MIKCYGKENRGCWGKRGVAVLNMVAREAFTDKMAFEVSKGASGEDVWRKSDPGRKKDRFKSLEAGVCLACLKSSKEASVAVVGEEVKEMTWDRGACKSLHREPW